MKTYIKEIRPMIRHYWGHDTCLEEDCAWYPEDKKDELAEKYKDNDRLYFDERFIEVQDNTKIGHWVKYGIPRCDEQHYQCTACNYYINFGKWGDLYAKEFKYCPHCGAKMINKEEKINGTNLCRKCW